MTGQAKNVGERFGSVTIYGTYGLNMSQNRITNVADPVASLDGINKAYLETIRHVGDIKMSILTSDHHNWLVCNGRSLLRSEYPVLFSIIGTSFGSASGTTFNLPDCRGRVLGSIGQGSGLTNRSIGATVGEETHLMTTTEMPSHTHTGTTNSSGAHTHEYYTGRDNGDLSNIPGQYPPGDGTTNVNNLTTSSAGAHTHTFTTDSAGSGVAFNVMQPTVFIGNVFIYSKAL